MYAIPNQSFIDLAIQATGSLEAGMQFCQDNAVNITDTPTPGTNYTVSAAAITLGDPGTLANTTQNQTTFGTLGQS